MIYRSKTGSKKTDALVKELAEAFEQMMYQLVLLGHQLPKSATSFTAPQLRILFTLSFNNSPLKMSEIANRIGVTMGTLTQVSKRLVKLEYLIRERSLEDDRIVTLCLSKKGEKIVDEIKVDRLRMFSEICKNLNQEDCLKLIESHRYILETYRNLLKLKKGG